ncbi:MAG: hypothetical protein KAX63_06030 [Pseudomonas sp.]|jgi:hypothetical protein|uniref:hypothetical protein n=1 Tax=Pseudomonas sp. TaxID=306 RepID=UPI000BC7D8CC|nr:hypothetical protein [Pseudomonas sp.]MBP8237258.1 hypothetical protein [Pseudomonas sp.]MBT9531162.1 hypothetical protein [Pseudomonas sp.]OYT96834.1 MAG: hypothetical protein CFE49_05100 [Pseudomonas sp. PGPPP3]HRL95050.1 hypothetical protein [Pseudomonas sp.]
MDLQIDDFYKDAAAGMLLLYQSFPRKIGLYVEDLIGREEPDEFGLPTPRHQSCLGTLLWLAEEGYIRFDSTIGYDALDQATLSEKGFLRLSRGLPHAIAEGEPVPPSVRRVQATLAYQLREALSSRQSERVVRLTRQLFTSTLNGNDTV